MCPALEAMTSESRIPLIALLRSAPLGRGVMSAVSMNVTPASIALWMIRKDPCSSTCYRNIIGT